MRFINERRGKIMSEVHKEGAKRWGEISEEAKRPYVEKYEADIENWKAEKAQMKAQFEAMVEEDKRGEKENPKYNGRTLFYSEVQIPGATFSDFCTKAAQMWNDLTPEERKAYHERARKITEKGQGDLLAATMRKIKSPNSGRPVHASMQFRNKLLSDRLKEAHKEIKREWSELSDEERDYYAKQYEEETKLFNAQMEEYRAGDAYAGNTRNMKVLKAKIKQIEEEMNKPKLTAHDPYLLFKMDNRESLAGKIAAERNKIALEMWEALTEEERMKYKAKWSKLKANWQTDVAKWEERNADNPKMTELKTNKKIVETAKKRWF